MKKPRRTYCVYSRYGMDTEDTESSFRDSWHFEGETWAVSERQAINNVRHNNYGDYGASQYKPLATSGHWETRLDWKAEPKYPNYVATIGGAK